MGSLIKAQRLDGVNESLATIVRRAIKAVPFDVIVVEGLRTKARQVDLYAQGRTKPGKVVTWTLDSKHIQGRAVDLAPMLGDAIDWSDPKKFDAINNAMQAAAREAKANVRWGADWDQDGNPRERGETDSPHWELA